ncbi:MAG: MMPL family transporter [Candidatus Methanomethylophilaceae archaeon]|nr:MMPL family transporter [Candidatus Methanomethylophilaceae archaeon]
MFAKTADLIVKHSKAVIALWIVVLICAVPFIMRSGDVLQYDITEMSGVSTESTDGQRILDEYFSNSLDLSEILVISYENATELEQAKAIFASFKTILEDRYDVLTATYYGEFSKDDNDVGISLVAISCNADGFDITHETGNIRELVAQAESSTGYHLKAYVTGNAAIAYDTEKSSVEDVSKVDPLSIALIFILLGLFFYALVTAVIPPGVVGVAYGIALSAVFGIGCVLDIYYVTEMLVLVTMLGAGCDYALFIISRYRDEAKKGASHEEALRTAIQWAGESVFTSGLAVIIGFGALSICSFSLVRSMGLVLAIGIVIALIAALTLIPSILNILGERIFWPSKMDIYRSIDSGERKGLYATLCKMSHGYFGWLSVFTHRYAVPIVVAWIVISVPATYIFLTTEDSSDMISIMPQSESVDGLNLIMTQTDGGTIMPTYVIVEMRDPIISGKGTISVGDNQVPYVQWTDAAIQYAIPALMLINSEIESKYDIVGSSNSVTSWAVLYEQVKSSGITDPVQINQYIYGQLPSAVKTYIGAYFQMAGWDSEPSKIIGAAAAGTYVTLSNDIDYILNCGTGLVSDDGRYVNMMVITSDRPMSDGTMAFIDDLKRDFHDAGGYDQEYSMLITSTYVSGTSAVMNDISKEVEDQFSVIRIVVIALLIVLLFLILGSYLTPIRSMITIVMSIIWTIALTHTVFTTMMSTPVLWLVPIVLFVVLLGLGMDYDIFLTTRIKENRNMMSDDEAIDDAVRKAGPVISLCSLIMGGTFLTMLLTSSSLLQEFGFALGVGILIEGLLTVGFVVPALMHLMGRWSWAGPSFLKRGA